MKVVHLTSVHPYNDTRIFHKECLTLAQSGYEVVLIAPGDVEKEHMHNVKVKFVPKPRNRCLRILFTDWHVFISALVEKAEVYHFHDPELLLIGLLLKMLTRAKVIYDVHEDNPNAILERDWIFSPLRKVLSRTFGFIERFTSRFFDAVITADENVANQFEAMGIDVITLYNFPLKSLYKDVQPRTLFENSPISLVYVGVIGRIRGLWLMLEALEILLDRFDVDVELVLAGEIFNMDEQRQFETYVDRRNILKDRVNWLGRIPQSKVVQVLTTSDIGWVPLAPIPKFYKNIPTKQFEYMASGIPVVGSDLPPIRRFVEAAQAGCLAQPDNPYSHAEKIYYLINQPDLAQQMGSNGRCAFENDYNWDSETKKMINLYRSLTD